VAANTQAKPVDLGCESAENWLLPSTSITAIVIITQPVSIYSFYCAMEGETESEEELIKRLNEWKDNVMSKGMRVNMNKTKVMISGERLMVRQKAVRWPCGVCSKGVGSNSIQCTSCQKWVHKKCNGIKGSMLKVAKSFICRGCLNPVTSAGRTSVDSGASAKLELVDKFCYLGDMLSVDGDADATVEARIRIGWNKLRQLVPLLTNKDCL